MTNSRNKGKRGELRLVHEFQAWGWPARRGQQYSGANGDADIEGVPYLHIECKWCNTMKLYKWLEQSYRDARPDEIPVVCHLRDKDIFKITLAGDRFMEIFRAYAEGHDYIVRDLHILTKCSHKTSVHEWLDISAREAGAIEIPIVYHHREEAEPFMVTLWLKDFMPMFNEYANARLLEEGEDK